MKRVDAVIVQYVVVEYDDHHRPVAEQLTRPHKCFRTRLEQLERQIEELERTVNQDASHDAGEELTHGQQSEAIE